MKLNRRSFLKKVGIGVGATVAAPAIAKIPNIEAEAPVEKDTVLSDYHFDKDVKPAISMRDDTLQYVQNIDDFELYSDHKQFTVPQRGIYEFHSDRPIYRNGVTGVVYFVGNVGRDIKVSTSFCEKGDIISTHGKTLFGTFV